MTICSAHDEHICVAKSVVKADSFATRLFGLLGHRSLSNTIALWIKPCKSVHTLGMRFPLDIVFVDASLKVIGLSANTPAWRIRVGPRGTRSVIELSAGRATACGLRVNDQLVIGHSLNIEKSS